MNIIFQMLLPKREELGYCFLFSGAIALCLGPPVGACAFCELLHRYTLHFWLIIDIIFYYVSTSGRYCTYEGGALFNCMEPHLVYVPFAEAMSFTSAIIKVTYHFSFINYCHFKLFIQINHPF